MSAVTVPEYLTGNFTGHFETTIENEPNKFSWDYAFLSSLVFYCVLFPIGIVGNLLSTIVVGYLIKYKRTRRITADLLLGLLAVVDLLCLITIHSISLVAFGLGKWPYPYEVCAYQGFATAVYLQLEFFLQVGISIDRYVALTRPIQYQQMSPSKLTRITPVILVALSIATTTVMIGWTPESATRLSSWYFCMFLPDPSNSIVDTVVVTIMSTIFLAGFVTFAYCNINLVRILWQYNAQKTKHVLQELSVAVQVMEKKTVNSKQPSSQPASPEVKEAALLSAKHHSKSKSGSRPSATKLQPPKDQQQNDKDQEIMNDLMTDIVQLRHRLSTQLQVAPFLTGSSANIPGSRKSSVSKLKDIGVKINKDVLDATTLESTDTIDILDKLARHNDSIPASRTNSESKLLENHATKEQSSLENIIIEVPKLPMVQQNVQRQQQELGTTCIPKLKRSRTFSDIHEISNSSCSSRENSNSSLHDIHRCRSVDKMQKYASTASSVSFRSSNNLLLPPDSEHCKNYNREGIENDTKMGRPRLDATGTSPEVSPEKTTNHVNEEQQKYKSKKPTNVVLSNGLANCSMPMKENGKVTSSKTDSEEHMSHFHRQMRKLLKRVERKAEKQRREILLARLVLLCALMFLITWLPFVVMNIMLWANVFVHDIAFDIAVKLVFSNIILNPVFYGLCRSNYRKGYEYVLHMIIHFVCCGLVKKPGDDKAFFDSKKRKQKRLQAAAEINMNQRINKMRKRRISAHALQVLHTLHFRNISSPPKSPLSFKPSSKLQDLFDRYEAESESDSDTSSIDYDVLALDMSQGPDNFYKSLRHMWSMYVLNGNGEDGCPDDNDEEFDLDVDYDAMIEDNAGHEQPSDTVFLDCDRTLDNVRRFSEGSWEKDKQSVSSSIRLAVSTPSESLRRQLDYGINNISSEQLITKL